MAIITILISAVIAAGLSVVFRQLDKENNSMEKVKKYADKRLADFDGYFRERENRLAGKSAEMDTQQMQAVAAVNRLNAQLSDFKKMSEELQSNINSVKNVEQKINSYNTALTTLMDMTGKVEENLNRLRKESSFVEKMDGHIDSQKKSLDIIEKRIPQLSAEFVQTNSEQLKTLGSKLTEEYQKQADDLTKQYDELKKQADDTLAQIQQSISAAYGDAARRADQLEDTAFSHLSELSQQRSDSYRQTVEATAADLQNLLEDRTVQIQKQINDSSTASETKVNECVSTLDDEVTRKYQELTDKYDQRSGELATQLDSKIADAQQRMTDTNEAVEEKYRTKFQELSDKYKQKTAEVDGELEQQYRTFAEKHKQQTELKDAELDQLYTALSEKYKQKSGELDAAFTQKTATVSAAFKDSTGTVIENVKKSMIVLDEKCRKYIDDFNAQYGGSVTQLKDTFITQLDTVNTENNKRITEMNSKFDTAYTDLSTKFSQKSEVLENQAAAVKNLYDEKENGITTELSARITALDDQYKKQITELRAQLGNSLDDVRKTSQLIADTNAGNEKSLETMQQELAPKLKEMQDRYAGLFDAAVTKADEKEKAALEKYSTMAANDIEKYHGAIKEKIDTLRESLTAVLKEVGEQADTSVQKAQSAVDHLQSECTAAEQRADSVAPQLEEKVQAVDAEIEKFRNQSESKITELEKTIDSSIGKLSLLCETRQTQALASVDEQLAGYKKDMEYRLSGLESSSGDVDTLENDLRIAMDEVRKRILTEFDTFTDEQQKKHSEFAESIKTDSDTIENELKVLESRIDELKTSSVSSVSEKLKGFETEFDNNLKMSTDKINEDIATWKNTFDGKISAFTGDYENQRRSLESKYSEDLKEKLAVLQEKNNEQVERTATGLKTMQESVQNQIDDIKNLIDGFANETRNKITESSAASDVFLKNASDQYKEQITGQLGKLQIELTERMKAFEDAMTVRQDTSSGTIDAALSEFNTWKQHLNQQLDESSDIFKEQLKNLKDSSEQKIAETTKAISKNLTGYSDDIKKQEDSLSQQLADLHTQADNSVATYEERSKDILDKLQGMYEDMLKDTEARVRTQMNDSSATLNNLKEEIKKTTAESSANQAKLVFKMQNDANDMQSRMSEISKELQTIRSQMQVYDKADQMKKQLDEKITSLEDDFSRIDTYSSTAATLTSQYNAICKMNDDISSRVKDFETQKNKVENLGKEYDKMINLSGTIDQKVKDLQTTSDDLTQMEVAVRNFQDTLTAISGRYDRLEQKQPVVDRVMKDVDASFDNMKALEDRLKNCSRQADSLPQEIKDLQNNVDELLKNGPKIGDAVSHISSLQSVLEETDKRIETINSARQGIGRSEERLNQLSSDIDSKFKLLGQLTKQDLEKHPSKGSDHISPQERESIKALKRQGWSVSEIARSMKRTETEIELILEMPDA